SPWKYLGWTITQQTIWPQKLELEVCLKTLHDAQKLLGDLQWLKPIIGIPNELLQTLRPLLKGVDPAASVSATAEQTKALQQIVNCIERGFVSRCILDLPITFTLWNTPSHLLGALTQVQKKTGEHRVLEWLSPPLQARKTITRKTISTNIEQIATLIRKGRMRIIEVTGMETPEIYLPTSKEDLDWYLVNSMDLQAALLGAGVQVHTGPLIPQQLQWLGEWDWVTKPLRSDQPIPEALTVFTDAGKKSRTAAVTWKEGTVWKYKLLSADAADSLQTLELFAIVWALNYFSKAVNVVTDSFYAAGVAQRIEDATVKEVQNKRLYELLLQLQRTLRARNAPYCIIHIRSHKWDVGL
ncbi:PO113 protein, partial [Nesospiza acunhae]|nr:PO113 protein [Nesospiza acunhae]